MEGKKHDQNKIKLSLVNRPALDGIARAMTFGMDKYGKNNYKLGMNWSRVADALLRHTTAWLDGEELDPESGLCHIDHIGACYSMLAYFKARSVGKDDR